MRQLKKRKVEDLEDEEYKQQVADRSLKLRAGDTSAKALANLEAAMQAAARVAQSLIPKPWSSQLSALNRKT